MGSTRPGRIGPVITKWVQSFITTSPSLDFEIVDLAEWDLPLYNEPGMPRKGEYVHEKTKLWSKKINAMDGFIFITPQYNFGYPAVLKNAIDYLFNEWTQKPTMVISYANRGGGKAAAQLRQVLEGIRMDITETMPAIEIKDFNDGAARLLESWKQSSRNRIELEIYGDSSCCDIITSRQH
ncbi:unnamed protein product [Mucor hiemalis]